MQMSAPSLCFWPDICRERHSWRRGESLRPTRRRKKRPKDEQFPGRAVMIFQWRRAAVGPTGGLVGRNKV